ncbi:MAG: GTP-binding protein [Deltaproteobacteria bacterium]|nr:GTP-binding protein [Deltaproteobacteria bacterium]
MDNITKVYLITGFLGSGKTTFLNRIIKTFPKDRKLMILMNEFGEIGIDGNLIEGEDLDILEISKGSIFCVCVKTDFIKGLNQIAKDIQPDILLIESTGVANPTDLKRDLTLPFFQNRFQLTEQFCIIDAANFEEEYEVFSSVEKQIASSTLFIINKVDLASKEQIQKVKDLVARHHPNPKFFETQFADFPFERFFFEAEGPGQPETRAKGAKAFLSDQELESAIEQLLDDPQGEITPPDRLLSAIYKWEGDVEGFKTLMSRFPKGIIRAKGFLGEASQAYLFSLVLGQRNLDVISLPADRLFLLNRVVFIAPPEIMPQLEALQKDFSLFQYQSTFDPMGNKEKDDGP